MLRIAFDLDGTLADLRSALDRIAEELFPDALTASPAKAGLHEERAATSPAKGGLHEDDGAASPAKAGLHEERAATSPAKASLHDDDGAARPAKAGLHEERDGDAGALAPEEEQLEPPELKVLSRRQQQQIWDTVRGTTNFWETLGETEPGIVARIAAVAEARRWEVLFITQRPAADGDTTQRQSQRWLAAHGFPMPSVYVLSPSASRGKVAAALSLDVLVDDRSEHCLDVKLESKARAFLVARDAARAAAPNAGRLGIEVVTTVGECLDLLSAAPKEKDGLLGQIKRIFTRSGQA